MQPVKIYTTLVCPYCNAAKDLFKNLEVPYEEIRLDQDPDLWERLTRENNGWRTVPMIFVGDRFLGGFTDVSKLHSAGGLMQLVNA